MLSSAQISALGNAAHSKTFIRRAQKCLSQRAAPFRQTVPHRGAVPHRGSRRCRLAAQQDGDGGAAVSQPPVSAEDAVERGLKVFQSGRAGEAATREALQLFETAMQLQPSRPEARAALFNAGCCHVKLRQWQAAVDAVEEAVNEQGLKLSVALEDPDLAPLRERREWLDVVGRLRGGVSDNALVQLRSEAKAPFRLVRLILAGGLLAGAVVGLGIIAFRLIQALQGGEGAPDLRESLQNLGINGAAVAVLGFIVRRDLDASERDKRIVQREEGLGRLQVAVSGGDRVLPLASFRGTTRPVLLAGSRAWLSKTLASAEPFREELRKRGVSLVPLRAAQEGDFTERLRALKREIQSEKSGAKGFGAEKPPEPAPAKVKQASEADRKWQLEPVETAEWLAWMAAQQTAANVKAGENVYVQVSLDGTVRSSGVGVPPWERWMGDLAPLDDVRSKLTKQ